MNTMFYRILLLNLLFILKCSISQSLDTDKIVGGQNTDISKVPYQAVIIYDSYFICGGSIIDDNWIASAAHCFYGFDKSLYEVRVGSSNYDTGGYVVKVTKVIIHEKYNPNTVLNDIAIIKLQTSLKDNYGKTIQPVNLPPPTQPILDLGIISIMPIQTTPSTGTISGWGTIKEGNAEPSEMLQSAVVDIFQNSYCLIYAGPNYERDSMLCAGKKNGGVDTCQGDSGGPLVANNILYGITSYGNGCARPDNPGVYTRVSSFVLWTTKNIASN